MIFEFIVYYRLNVSLITSVSAQIYEYRGIIIRHNYNLLEITNVFNNNTTTAL